MVKTRLRDILLLRELDRAYPYTVADVAREAGLHFETVSRFRRNLTTRFDADVLNALCGVLDVTPGDLLIYVPNGSEGPPIV